MSSKLKLMLSILLVCTASTGTLLAQQFPGSISITDKTGDDVKGQDNFDNPGDVYLAGGPEGKKSPGLPDGTYYFQVTDPSGNKLLSTDDAKCRQVVVTGGKITGVPASESCSHTVGLTKPGDPSKSVQLAPYSETTDNDGEYRVWLIRKSASSTTVSSNDHKVIKFSDSQAKTEKFRVKRVKVPAGSCQPSASMSVLVVGDQVFSAVPKGSWSTETKDIGVVMLEPHAAPVTQIKTAKAVNSCAANPRTLQTVCTTNDNDVYVFTGPLTTSTLQSGASGVFPSLFTGGECRKNCGVTMDAVHNEALLGITLAPAPPTFAGSGFQFLDLSSRPTFTPPFASQAPMPFNPGGEISKGILIDPIRNWILSANESGNYEIIKLGRGKDDKDNRNWVDGDDHDRGKGNDKDNQPAPRAFFENSPSHPTSFFFSFASAAEDCTTGIALAPLESYDPANTTASEIYLADLTRAEFTPGSPGTWQTQAQTFQQLLGSNLGVFGPNGIAVAQGTHTGVLIGLNDDNVTAIKLPAVSGGGPAPKIEDWVTCRLPAPTSIAQNSTLPLQNTGLAPHTVNAYESPNNGHAMAVIGNVSATAVWRVDLTEMLKLRRIAPNKCESTFLPSNVAKTIAVP